LDKKMSNKHKRQKETENDLYRDSLHIS
jgi:hypothetical protein